MLSYTKTQASATNSSYTEILEVLAMNKAEALSYEILLEKFKIYMETIEMGEETIKSYLGNVGRYFKWYKGSYGLPPGLLYRSNIKDFKSFLLSVKKYNLTTANYYLSALMKYNEFLIEEGYQTDLVVSKADYSKIQIPTANPWDGEVDHVYTFLQKVLARGGSFAIRDYALFSVIAYAGTRNSETISILDEDVDLIGREILIRQGKGDKARVIIINSKIVHAIEEYRKVRPATECPYLFLNRSGDKLTRGRINQICNDYSDFITPHKLRHFYCSQSQEKAGYSIAQTAAQVGHKNTRTTLRYTHPSKAELKQKAELL